MGTETVRCSNCDSLNFWSNTACERCGQSLSDERNAVRAARRAMGEPAHAQPAITMHQSPAPTPRYSDHDDFGVTHHDDDDEPMLPAAPIVIKPDPFFGPIFRRPPATR